jgi:hypothetical protein
MANQAIRITMLMLVLLCARISLAFRARPAIMSRSIRLAASIINREENELNTQSSSFQDTDTPPSSVAGMPPTTPKKTQDFVQGFFATAQEDLSASDLFYSKEDGELLHKLRAKGSILLDKLKREKLLPFGKQEAWRHANLRKVFPALDYALPTSHKNQDLDTIKTIVDSYIHDECTESSIVMIDGVYCSELSRLNALTGQEGMTIHTLSQGVLSNSDNSDKNKLLETMINHICDDVHIMDLSEKDRDSMGSATLTAMSLAHTSDALSLFVHTNQHIETPLHILNVNTENTDSSGKVTKIGFPRLHIDVAQGSSLKIKQSFIGPKLQSLDNNIEDNMNNIDMGPTSASRSNLFISNTVIRMAANRYGFYSFQRETPQA